MEERGDGCWKRGLKITDRGGCKHGLLETEDKSSTFRCSGVYVDRPDKIILLASFYPRSQIYEHRPANAGLL